MKLDVVYALDEDKNFREKVINVPEMTGATASQAGAVGLVPAPIAGKQGSYLFGDATWGRDADVLAAIAAGQIGPAKNIVGNALDVDTLTSPGLYYLNGTGTYINLPVGVTLGYLTVHYVTSDGPIQQILQTHTNRVYLRALTSSVAAWTAWTQIANLSDIPDIPDVMTGATSSQAGTQGIVPAPAAGKQGSYLFGDATWGRDADVLAAIAAGQIGPAKNIVGNALDVDTLTSPGLYYLNGTGTYINLPVGVTLGYLTVHYVTSDGPIQQILAHHTKGVYFRAKSMALGSWSDWRRLAFYGECAPMPSVNAGVGQWRSVEDYSGNDYFTLPSGGTWAYIVFRVIGYMNINYLMGGAFCGISAGGATINPGPPEDPESHTLVWRGMAWRIV